MNLFPLCVALVEDATDCFEGTNDVGRFHPADDFAHFAPAKCYVNVSRLVVVGVDRNRELPNPRYLRHASRITQDLGICQNLDVLRARG